MTIRETILRFPGLADCKSYIDKVLIDRSIDGAANYTIDVMQTVNLCAADLYSMVGGLPDFTENKLSITYPRSWYNNKAKELYNANGESEKANLLGIQVPRGKSGGRW